MGEKKKIETSGSGSGTVDWTTGPGFSVPTGQKLIRLGRSTRLGRLHLAWLGLAWRLGGRRLFNLPSHENLQLAALHVARCTAPVRCIPQGVQAHIKIDRYAASCCSHSSCPALLLLLLLLLQQAAHCHSWRVHALTPAAIAASRAMSSMSSMLGQTWPGQQARSMFTMSSPGRSRPSWGSIFKAARYAHRKSNKCFCSLLLLAASSKWLQLQLYSSSCIVIAQVIDKLQISLQSQLNYGPRLHKIKLREKRNSKRKKKRKLGGYSLL